MDSRYYFFTRELLRAFEVGIHELQDFRVGGAEILFVGFEGLGKGDAAVHCVNVDLPVDVFRDKLV